MYIRWRVFLERLDNYFLIFIFFYFLKISLSCIISEYSKHYLLF